MAKREEILNAVRKALGKGPGSTSRPDSLPDFDPSGVMPPIAPEELLSRFEAELQAISGKTYRAESPASLEQILGSILGEAKATRAVLSRNPILRALGLANRLAGRGMQVAVWQEGAKAEATYREACFAAQAGITGIEFALAESGSLVIASRTEGSQLSSLAPPVHIALYRRGQLRASLDEILAALPVSPASDGPAPGRSVVFVSGPSRTADIEQILIRGVHGPRDVHAILVEDACFNSAATPR